MKFAFATIVLLSMIVVPLFISKAPQNRNFSFFWLFLTFESRVFIEN